MTTETKAHQALDAYARPAEKTAGTELPERIRVMHIITKLEFGGAQLNTLYTVEKLDRGRFDVALLSNDEGFLVERAKAIPHLECFFVPELERSISPARDWRALIKIIGIIRRWKPDVVHTHSSKAGITGRLAAWWAGVPVIIHTIHGFAFSPYLPKWRNRLYVFLERIAARVTTKFIAVARANIEQGMGCRIFGEHDAVVIRSGVDLKLFSEARVDRAAKRAEFGIPVDAKVALMVACLKPQKAPLDFVKVARRVHEQIPEARFLMVGDGEMRPLVESSIRRHGLEGIVILAGWREDVPEIMKASDVLVLTSLWEGLPQVYPQAMAAGLPIVGTDVDGADEVVHHNMNGFLVPCRAISRMADALVVLFNDDAMRARMAEVGKRYLAGFDRDTMVEEQEILYLQLLWKHREKIVVGAS